MINRTNPLKPLMAIYDWIEEKYVSQMKVSHS
jgi:hypothetical protein